MIVILMHANHRHRRSEPRQVHGRRWRNETSRRAGELYLRDAAAEDMTALRELWLSDVVRESPNANNQSFSHIWVGGRSHRRIQGEKISGTKLDKTLLLG